MPAADRTLSPALWLTSLMIGSGEYPELEAWKSWYRRQLPSIPVATPGATLIRPGNGLPSCFVFESAQAVTSP